MNNAAISAISLFAVAVAAAALAQPADPLAPRPNGMVPAAPTTHLITNATVHTAPGSVLTDTDILIHDGRIIAVGPDLESHERAANATVWQIDGVHIYPGFIDPYIEVSTPDLPSSAAGTHWSGRITPHDDALRAGIGDGQAESLRKMGFTTVMIAPSSGIFRGWSAVVSTAADFEDESLGDPPVHKADAGQIMGFERGGWGDPGYPTSHMGVVALMRQTLADAQHRAGIENHPDSTVLDAIDSDEPFFFNTSHELESLLADDIAAEFGLENVVIVDNGTAHRRMSAFVDMGHPVIVPLTYPETPEVFSIGAADDVELAELQHWERAPANARWLHNAGLTVALTTSKLRSGEKFWDNLHTAIEKGLPADDAMAMMTTVPAEMLGLDDQGQIREGFIANLVVASDELFDPDADATILETWADGRRHRVNHAENTRFDGQWTINLVGMGFELHMSIDGKDITITADDDGQGNEFETEAKKVNIDRNQISFLSKDAGPDAGFNVITGTLAPDGTIRGTGMAPDQQTFQWTATRAPDAVTMSDFRGTWNAVLSEEHKLDFKIGKDSITVIERVEDGDDIEQKAAEHEIVDGVLSFSFEHEPFGDPGTFTVGLNAPQPSEDDADDDAESLTGIGTLPSGDAFPITATKQAKDEKDTPVHTLPDAPDYPFGPFSYESQPEQQTYLLTGATVWTQADRGVIEDGWVLIADGKVSAVGGDDRPAPRVREENLIDASGMHITPGLIDAHSHTGLFRFGVNESGQAVTSEVRIADSIDPAHPGYYREIAGGLTTSMLLHGSANPIGGQAQTIKLRWNAERPSDMFFEGAKPGIKFALGENVKQSNWGDRNTTRYPQTRMGVETLIRDRFVKAKEYADRDMKTEAGGRDLELEILAEILAGERMIHCHSYRQDEILMLCRIAEEFGFKIGTFQHGLETYKVAEIVKEHAIGTSIFSDWWAYKVEVVDAIPYAGPINHAVGLLTSFNSDSDDVARRMHAEAAKALKYAKLSGIEMSEQDALNFVTMNPAIQLGIDDRVGSLETGKDADVVVWTGHPLSSTARPEMTFIDGRLYFSRDLDSQLRARNTDQRQRLIQLIHRDGKPSAEEEDNGDNGSDHDHDHEAEPDSKLDHGGHRHTNAYADDHLNTDRGGCGCDQLLPAWNTDY